MFFRTDLALELQEAAPKLDKGIKVSEHSDGDVKVTEIEVLNEEGEKQLGKPIGLYITIELPPLTDNAANEEQWISVIVDELKRFIPSTGNVLVCGLGNKEITPDALGPKAAARVLATRHIIGELERSAGLYGLRSVAVLAPGVLGQTGIDAAELLAGASEWLKPDMVVVIDALASRSLSRLGCTIQISNTGISPGSGVSNTRPSIDQKSLGVPVVAIGIPTVVDAVTLAADILGSDHDSWQKVKASVSPRGEKMIVTPREIDLLIDRASELTAFSLNCALQPSLSSDDIRALL